MSGTNWTPARIKAAVAAAVIAVATITGYSVYNEGDAPDTPDAGKVALYAKADGRFYVKDDTGTERDVADGGDAATLSGLQSTQFLRTDEADELVGPLTLTGAFNLGAHAVLTEIAAPAVSASGKARLYADSTSHTLKLSTNGGAYSDVGAVTYKNTADSTPITGATETDTIFDTYHTIPANTLRAGSIIRCQAIGIHTTGSTTVTQCDLKVGTVSIAATGSHTGTTNDIFVFNYEIIIRTAGAGGTLVAHGYRIHDSPSGTGTARPTLLGETAIDTTGALTVGIWMDRGPGVDDGESAVLRTISVQVIY